MGMMENGTPEPESNMIEMKSLAQDKKCEPLTPENYGMDYERLGSETVEQKELTEAQNIEKKLVLMQKSSDKIAEVGPHHGEVSQSKGIDKQVMQLEDTQKSSDKIAEVGPNHGEISQNEGIDKQEPQLEDVNIFSVAGISECVSQNGLTDLAHLNMPLGTTSISSSDVKTEHMQDATINFVYSENGDMGLSGQPRKTPAKLKGPVTSSWTLRSKSQEKPKAPEPTDTIKEGSANEEKKRRVKKKKKMQKDTAGEFSRTRPHLRYLLHRINYEQNLIDAYSAEGWRGQSVDKLKPEKELEKAKSHILRYKLKIRALFQQLDLSLSTGKIPETLFDSKGEIDSEDIFCAKCGLKDLTLDNDIILCDGACERGFHQFCLEPPLLKKDIPPGDESWLCPGCDCKADCIEILRDFQGEKISILDSWEKIFPEAAAAASGKKLDDASGSTSDDSEDEEYDPDKPAEASTDENVEGDESSSDESSYFSASDDLVDDLAAPLNDTANLAGLPSDDSEDDDFDPSAPCEEEEPVKQDSSSSDFTSDSEDLEALLKDENVPGNDVDQIMPPVDHDQPSVGSDEGTSKKGRGKRQSLKDELSILMETSVEPVSSRRRVERLDYKKLHDETYGNLPSDSSEGDSDFDDTTTRKRTRTNHDKTEVKSSDETPITKSNKRTNDENQTESEQSPLQTCKNGADGGTAELSAKGGSDSTGTKRAKGRLGEATTQKLYASFNENQYPEKAVKENLAKELGLTVRQVSKWFENARWSFNHRPKMEPNSERPPEPKPTTGADDAQSNQNVQMQEPSGTPAQNHIAGAKEENPVTTSGELSGSRKPRKRKGTPDLAINDMQSPRRRSSQRQKRRGDSVS